MCFVSFVPVKDGYLVGSNRDEHINRLPALPPGQKVFGNFSGLGPTDGQAGGTWIATREDGWTIVLLNGAEKLHVASPPYRLSRGVIIPQLLTVYSPLFAWQQLTLDQIEPFTLILVSTGLLVEVRWDGSEKTERFPDLLQPHCWSSATLYNEVETKRRERLFLEAASDISGLADLDTFHTGTYGPKENDIMLARPTGLKTVSTTIVQYAGSEFQMKYTDHQTQQIFTETIQTQKTLAV